jgi:hypothetical protein
VKGKREFNENQRDELIKNADKGKEQAEHFYRQINDWANKYKKYDSANLASNAKSYFEGLDKALDKSKEDINKIYTAVEQVEKDYAEKFSNVAFEMGLYADRINALRDVLRPVGPVANVFAAPDFADRLNAAKQQILEKEILFFIANPDKLANLDFESRGPQEYINFISEKYRGQDMFNPKSATVISDVERDLLVMCYKYLHPQNAKTLNGFLASISKCGPHDKEIQDIKYLAYASPELYQAVLFKYLPQITIKEHHESGTQYFQADSKGGNNIYIDVGRVIDLDSFGKPSNVGRGAYATFFHEIGHAVDKLMGEEGYANSTSINDTIKRDVNNALKADIERRFPQPLSVADQANAQIILDSLQKGNTATGDPKLDSIRQDVQDHFSKNVLKGGHNNTASDTYGGVTGNNIVGTWKHSLDSNGNPYWDTHEPSLEFFANAFSRHITNYRDALKSIDINFPEASKAFEALFKGVKLQ